MAAAASWIIEDRMERACKASRHNGTYRLRSGDTIGREEENKNQGKQVALGSRPQYYVGWLADWPGFKHGIWVRC